MTPDRRELLAHARRMAEKGAPGAAAALAALEREDAIETLRTTPMALGRTTRRRIPSETNAHPDHAPTCDLNSGDSFDVSRGCSCRPRTTSLLIRLPWSTLLPDNEKWAPALGRNNKPKLLLTEDYRERKARMEAIAREQVGDAAPFTVPVRFEARVYVPDRRRRDIGNFGKLVQDALTGIAYADDSLIDDLRWIRAGVDIDAPRVALLIQPL